LFGWGLCQENFLTSDVSQFQVHHGPRETLLERRCIPPQSTPGFGEECELDSETRLHGKCYSASTVMVQRRRARN
jgi:hypothetical protein